MAIVGNGVRLATNPMRNMGAASLLVVDRGNYGKPGATRNWWAGEATENAGASIANRDGIPSGYTHPGAWSMAPKAGGLASRSEMDGSGTVSAANLAGGLNAASTLTGLGTTTGSVVGLGVVVASLAGSGDLAGAANAIGTFVASLAGTGTTSSTIRGLGSVASSLAGSGDITGALGLVVFAEATLAGAGSVSADMGLVVQAVAALSGVGGLSADVVGELAFAASLAGSGDLVGTLGALAGAVATMSGTSSVSATPRAVGSMSADITSEGELLTTGNVGAAVWNALASALGDAGTMGELLIGAGGGSSPSQVADAVWAHADGADLTAKMLLVSKILRNRTDTNPATGVMTVYDDDGTTPLLTAAISEDVAGTTPYDGTAGVNRRNRLA